MRIAGGVILLIVGLWSLVGGGCSLVGGKMAGGMAEGAAKLSAEMNKAAQKAGGTAMNKEAAAQMAEGLEKAGSVGSGLMISGVVILIAGILAIVGGIMFFVNKAKMLGFAASGVGILGEIIFFATVTFNIGGLLKILLLAFCGFAATKIGQETSG